MHRNASTGPAEFIGQLVSCQGIRLRLQEGKVMSVVRISTAILACALAVTALPAQQNPTAAAESGSKVGAINMRQAIASTAEGKQASAQLESQFLARRKELESLTKQINDLQQRLASGANTLSDEEKTRLTLQGQRLTQQLERKQNEFQEDVNNAQSDVVNAIGRKLLDVVVRYAPSNGYSAILDNSSQNSPVLFASSDITQNIVRLYDQTYPVKSAAPAGVTPKPPAKPSGN
jgi:outer membrane protein